MRLKQVPKTKLEPRPQVILAGRLLQLGTLDLEEEVSQELAENPALELEEEGRCSKCGALFSGESCPVCSWDFYPVSSGEDFDPFAQVPSTVPLSEFLLRQVLSRAGEEDYDLATYVVDSLDEHGLLTCDLREISKATGRSVEEVEGVLSILQEQEPIGVGARSVQECLLIQLRYLEGLGNYERALPLAATVVRDHWDRLAKRQFERIAESLAVKVGEVEEAADFIRRNLNPYPAQAYQPSERPAYIRPDVMIRRHNERLEVEIPEEGRYRFRVDSSYEGLLAGSGSDLDDEAKEYLKEYISRAHLFMSCFAQRWKTLRLVAEFLAAEQRDFFLEGVRRMRPLTRAEVALALGLHESTVSRAVSDKYLQTPQGQIIPMADLFDASLAAKDMIRELVEKEAVPLSDEELQNELAKQGLALARRTVAKYRQAMGILPANLRQPRGSKEEA